MCIMDQAGVKEGVCVGNDFGAQVCWEAGRSRPDRFIGGEYMLGIKNGFQAKLLQSLMLEFPYVSSNIQVMLFFC